MAGIQTMPDPMKMMQAARPQQGPNVQNMGGFGQSTQAPVRQFQQPASIQSGPSGPAPGAAVAPQAGVGQLGAGAGTPGPAGGGGVISPMNMPAAARAPNLTRPQHLGQASLGGLESGLREFVTGAMSGDVVSPEQIQRMKSQAFQAARGQFGAQEGRINDDALRRGLYGSGIPAEGIAAADRGANQAYTSSVADILSGAEGQNVAGRFQGAGLAQGLLGDNRGWQQYQNSLADARSRAAAGAANANANRTFRFVDPDSGQAFDLPSHLF